MSFSISDNTLIIALYSNGDPFLPTCGLSVFCCRMTQRTKTNLAMVRSTWLLYLIPVILVLSQGIAGPTHQRAQLHGSVFSSFGKIAHTIFLFISVKFPCLDIQYISSACIHSVLLGYYDNNSPYALSGTNQCFRS
mgnify:CR=1 FL=1